MPKGTFNRFILGILQEKTVTLIFLFLFYQAKIIINMRMRRGGNPKHNMQLCWVTLCESQSTTNHNIQAKTHLQKWVSSCEWAAHTQGVGSGTEAAHSAAASCVSDTDTEQTLMVKLCSTLRVVFTKVELLGLQCR